MKTSRHPARKESGLDFHRGLTVAQAEEYLANLSSQHGEHLRLRLPSDFNPSLLGDVWSMIAVGSLCRRNTVNAVPWGLDEPEPKSPFVRSLHGATALHMASSCTTEKRPPVDLLPELLVDTIKRAEGRLEDRLEGQEQTPNPQSTLVEFDPSPIVPRQFRKGYNTSSHDLVDRMGRVFAAEQSFVMQSHQVAEDREAKLGIITFFKELYENSYQHARDPLVAETSVPSVRALQIKFIPVQNNKQLKDFVEGHPEELKEYATSVLSRSKRMAFFRVMASDFGDGMLNYFLRSERGVGYAQADRTELLQKLVHTPLTSKRRTGAGYGLTNVMEFASKLRAFVSLRTNEKWLAASYLTAPQSGRGVQLSPVDGREDYADIPGTHWQILWPVTLAR